MNAQDRQRLARVYDVLNAMTALGPSNPADLKRVVAAHQKMREAARMLLRAVDSIGYREWQVADDYLAEAERAVDG